METTPIAATMAHMVGACTASPAVGLEDETLEKVATQRGMTMVPRATGRLA